MDDYPPAPSARFVAESVFAMLEAGGWERARSRWVVAEVPGQSSATLGIEAFRTHEDNLDGLDAEEGLVGRRAGPEVVGMAIAGAVVSDVDRTPESLHTVLAADRFGRWFRVAAGPGGAPLRTPLAWFDGPGSAMRCHLGAPWHGPPPPPAHEVCSRWWLGLLLTDRLGVDRSVKLEALSADLQNRESLILRDGWVPLVPEGWNWDEVRQAWAEQAACRGDGALAELVRWADAPELAARIRRATAVIDPDRLATFASRSASPLVRQLLIDLGMFQEVV